MIGVGKAKQYANVLDKPLSRGRQEFECICVLVLRVGSVQPNTS